MKLISISSKAKYLFIALVILLAGCSGAQAVPTSTAVLSSSQTPGFQITLTPTEYQGVCSFVWANRAQPDISIQLKKAFRDASLPEVDVDASAYGENCLDISTNSVVYFTPTQTDLSMTVVVDDTSNTSVMGEWIIKIYGVLENLQPGTLPGSKLGNLQVQYEDTKALVSLNFTHKQGQDAIKQGLRGTRLFDALNTH